MKYILLALPLLSLTPAHAKTWKADCHFFYRESVTVAPKLAKKLTLNFDDSGLERGALPTTFEAGVFSLTVGDGGALSVAVSITKTKQALGHGLWQTVRNIDDNHGITGLHYFHGLKGEQLQYFCKEQ